MSRATYLDHKRLVRGANQFMQMLRCDCIQGYAVGRKRVKNKELSELAIVFYVSRKLGLRQLPLVNRIPKTIRIPDDRASGGVLEFITDVREGRFSSLENVARMRPAPSGISIGHYDITAGTLGGLVRHKTSGEVVILSNNHVLANSNNASIGDAVLQPGPHDGGTDPDDRIATLTDFVPIDFEEGAENRVDGAIATPVNAADVVWNTLSIGAEVPASGRDIGEDDLGAFVQKTGRTTEFTDGFIQAVNATVQVKYDLFQKATFVDQIIISQPAGDAGPFSAGGDSGSLVYDEQHRCVGLLFAGSERTETEPATTIINPIRHVLNELNIEFLSPGDHATAARPRRKKATRMTKARAGRRKR